MCRLAFITAKYRGKGLLKHLVSMEKSFGGHGCGIAFGNQLIKKVTLDATSCGQLANSSKLAKVNILWHTRLVSCGDMTDDLCHPFCCDGGFLAHNGHWYAGASTAKYLSVVNGGDYSDSRVFSQIVHKLGLKEACEQFKPNGVWLHMRKGECAVYKNSGDLYWHSQLGYASEPKGNAWKPVANGYTHYGDDPKTERRIAIQPKIGYTQAYTYKKFAEEYEQYRLRDE